MRSRADAATRTARPAVEWALRLLALAVVAWLLWRELRPAAAVDDVRVAAAEDDVGAALRAWTVDPAATRVHLSLGAAPTDTVRAWVRALRAAGVAATYDAAVAPIAVAAAPLADPAGGWRVLAAAPTGGAVTIADAAGTIDSLQVAGAGASVLARSLEGAVRVASAGTVARTSVPASPTLRAVVVLGRAGWESKFAIAALEERGWTVRARLAVAPGVVVEQGGAVALDTARTAAVVALDTTAAAYAPAVARFVRSGGGVVLAAEALAIPALRALAPARAGAPLPPDPARLASDEPRRALALEPLVSLVADAVPLELRDGRVAAAARRVGAGRVVLVGYADTWRWRMAGPEGAPDAHRAWWAGMLAAAAYAPAPAESARSASLDAAPAARLIAALGPPADGAPARATAASGPRTPPPWWLFALVAVALLAEWASRRARGRR